MTLQRLYGPFPRVLGKGDFAQVSATPVVVVLLNDNVLEISHAVDPASTSIRLGKQLWRT